MVKKGVRKLSKKAIVDFSVVVQQVAMEALASLWTSDRMAVDVEILLGGVSD